MTSSSCLAMLSTVPDNSYSEIKSLETCIVWTTGLAHQLIYSAKIRATLALIFFFFFLGQVTMTGKHTCYFCKGNYRIWYSSVLPTPGKSSFLREKRHQSHCVSKTSGHIFGAELCGLQPQSYFLVLAAIYIHHISFFFSEAEKGK